MIKQSETQLLLHRAFLLGYACLLFGIAMRNVFHVNIPVFLFLDCKQTERFFSFVNDGRRLCE